METPSQAPKIEDQGLSENIIESDEHSQPEDRSVNRGKAPMLEEDEEQLYSPSDAQADFEIEERQTHQGAACEDFQRRGKEHVNDRDDNFDASPLLCRLS
ncbi:hypothetical protein KI387_012742, partial [Taxus chinensis]